MDNNYLNKYLCDAIERELCVPKQITFTLEADGFKPYYPDKDVIDRLSYLYDYKIIQDDQGFVSMEDKNENDN